MIHPLVLGSGRRLFGSGVRASLALVESVTSPTGVVMATYARER
jgi:tRNA A37 threonylcarbamoyladenosine biosynthesis protein TsaE